MAASQPDRCRSSCENSTQYSIKSDVHETPTDTVDCGRDGSEPDVAARSIRHERFGWPAETMAGALNSFHFMNGRRQWAANPGVQQSGSEKWMLDCCFGDQINLSAGC